MSRKERKKCRKKTYGKIKRKSKEKWKDRKIQKQRMCKIERSRSIGYNEGKWAKKMIYAYIFRICFTSFIDSLWKLLSFLVEFIDLQPH